MRLVVIIISLMVLWSCNSDEDKGIRHTMEDGVTFCTDGEVYSYTDLKSFIGIKERNEPTGDVVIDFQEWEKDSIYGYDRLEILGWEEVNLGRWCERYGINSGKNYYAATIKVIKDLPIPMDRTVTCRGYDVQNRDSIGLNLRNDAWGFVVSNNNYFEYCEAYTIIKKIEYDCDGKKICKFVPLAPSSVKWIYYTTKNIW